MRLLWVAPSFASGEFPGRHPGDLEMGWPGAGVTSWLVTSGRSTEGVTSQTPEIPKKEGKRREQRTISVARQKSARVLPSGGRDWGVRGAWLEDALK